MKAYFGGKTHFSIGQSIYKPEALIDAATHHEFLAVADTGTINGLPMLFDAAKKKALGLNVGVALRVVDDPEYKRPKKKDGIKPHSNGLALLKFYPTDEEGLKIIFQMMTVANQRSHVASEFKNEHSGPQISWQEAQHFIGMGHLLVTTGDLFGVFSDKNWHTRVDSLVDAINSQTNIDAGNLSALFVELTPIDTAYHISANERGYNYAKSRALPIIASFPALYPREEADVRDVMNDIVDKSTITNKFRNIPYDRTMFVKTDAEMYDAITTMAFKIGADDVADDLSDELDAGMELFVHRSNYKYENMPVSLPVMAADPFRKLAELSMRGWKARIEQSVMGYKPDASLLPQYRERLKYELTTLKNMGFENYFLLVEEVVNWSKTNGIRVGPGRGSVGGSLVAFLLGITDVDPIRFGLLFERFINPDRLDLPDADLDFMSSRRDEVIQHLISKYGQEYVASISNYNMLASASALRAAGKIYGLEEWQMSCSKLVPKEHGQPKPLEEAVLAVPEIEKFATENPKVFEMACKLQDTYRAAAQHAAGVIVAGEPIINRAVIEEREGGNVVNWDKQVVENFGLVKLDVLGLSTLDVIDQTIKYIHEKDKRKHINMMDVKLDDKKVLEEFGKGKTIGVFQFESGGMRGLLKNMASSGQLRFEDLAAATSLYRPGPLDAGLLDKYVAIKQGAQREDYPHPLTEAALKETYSVMVYQEQVMQVARDLSGFTMTEADHLRKAIGKKDKVKMAKMAERFIEGAIAGTIRVELDDGRIIEVHRMAKYKVKEQSEPMTVEEIAEKGYTLLDSL